MLRIIAIAAIFFLQVQSGFACKCNRQIPDIGQACQKADLIFLGQCLRAEYVEEKGSSPYHFVQYTFLVKKVWKGKPDAETILVKTGLGGGDCGWNFRPGFSYIVFGTVEKNSVHTSTCTRTLNAGFYPHLNENAKDEMKALDTLKQ